MFPGAQHTELPWEKRFIEQLYLWSETSMILWMLSLICPQHWHCFGTNDLLTDAVSLFLSLLIHLELIAVFIPFHITALLTALLPLVSQTYCSNSPLTICPAALIYFIFITFWKDNIKFPLYAENTLLYPLGLTSGLCFWTKYSTFWVTLIP